MSVRAVRLSQLVRHLAAEVNRANYTALGLQAEILQTEANYGGGEYKQPALVVEKCEFTLHLAPARPSWIVRVWHWLVQFFGGSIELSPISYKPVSADKAEMEVRVHIIQDAVRTRLDKLESNPPQPELANLKVQLDANPMAPAG